MAKLTNEERLAKLLARKQKDEEELKKLKAEIRKENKEKRLYRDRCFGEVISHRVLPKRTDQYSEEEFEALLKRWKQYVVENAETIKEIL